MPIEATIRSLAEHLKNAHPEIVPVASLTVLGLGLLDRLERQGVSTRLLRKAANDCVVAYLSTHKIERAEFDRAIQAIRNAGLTLGAKGSPH